MPGWLRRRGAENRSKRDRTHHQIREVHEQFRREVLRKMKSKLIERLTRNWNEYRERAKEIERLMKEAREKGVKHVRLYAAREILGRELIGDEAWKELKAGRYLQAFYLAILKKLDVDIKPYEDYTRHDIEMEILKRIGISRWHIQYMRAMMRTLTSLRKMYSFIRNPTVKQLNELYRHWEELKEVLNLPLLSHLIYHDVCVATRDLVKFDGTLPSRIYLAVSYVKNTFNVVATFGLLAALLALAGNIVNKPDGEFITSAKEVADFVESLNDKVAVIRDDANRYVVEYPLFFVLERPDRVEKWAAKALGRREMYDFTVHCSVYRAPIATRVRSAPRLSARTSRVRRLNVYLPIKWWGSRE